MLSTRYQVCILSDNIIRWFFSVLSVAFIRCFYPLILSRKTRWTWRGLRLNWGSLSSRLAHRNQRPSLALVVHTTLSGNVHIVFVVVTGKWNGTWSSGRYRWRGRVPGTIGWAAVVDVSHRFFGGAFTVARQKSGPATRSLIPGFCETLHMSDR